MSNATQAVTEGVVGPNDDTVTVLLADDLDGLTPVEELPDPEEKPETSEQIVPAIPGTEGLHFSMESFGPDLGLDKQVKACEEQPAVTGQLPPPMVSRTPDEKEGRDRITVVLGPLERTQYLGIVISLIDSASENDVVDISIIGNPGGQAGTMSQRSLLAAIHSCKGHVITRAGILTTVGDVAMWLSGKELRIPRKMGAIFMRQPVSGYMGDTADFESKLQDFKDSMKEFGDYIEARGLFQKEELDQMYQHRSLLVLFGDKLQERLKNLKQVD